MPVRSIEMKITDKTGEKIFRTEDNLEEIPLSGKEICGMAGNLIQMALIENFKEGVRNENNTASI